MGIFRVKYAIFPLIFRNLKSTALKVLTNRKKKISKASLIEEKLCVYAGIFTYKVFRS
jgi:hypothetical protein